MNAERFPAFGSGTWTLSWADTDFDDPTQDDSGSDTYTNTPDLISEHCVLNGVANKSESYGGTHLSYNVTFERHAQAVYELQTGGKGKPNRQNHRQNKKIVLADLSHRRMHNPLGFTSHTV